MSQRHSPLSTLIATAVAAIALGLPGLASAEYWHPANNEAGVVVHEEHFQSTKTRAQVQAEIAAARQQGCMSFGEGDYPCATPDKGPDKGPGKTRAQVIDELRNESAAERAARLSLMAN